MESKRFSDELLALKASLHRYALSLTGDVDNADDLVQDTFLKALTFKESFEENTNMRAWAFTIMRNTYINHYRHLSSHRHPSRIRGDRKGHRCAHG